MEFDRDKLNTELLKDFDKTGERKMKKPEIDLDSEPGVPIKILVPLIFIIAITFGVYAWKTDKFVINNSDEKEVPIIRADKEPVRVTPNDPGGMYIANRDKLIYETISNKRDNSLPKVVKILPRHEEPVKRENIKKAKEELFESLPEKLEKQIKEIDELKIAARIPTKEKESKVIKKQELLSTDLKVLDEDMVSSKDSNKNENPITVDDIKNVPVPSIRTRGVVKPKEIKGGTKIQLGSFRTEGDVKKNWKSIKKKHSSLLGKFSLNTQKADLGDRGIFYRLRVGSLKNESEARKLCQKLIEQNQGCFVVKK